MLSPSAATLRLSAAVHAGATTKVVLAGAGAVSGLSAIGALFLGVLLRSG